jgi:hypothetical protein
MASRTGSILGGCAVIASLAISGFWSYWGGFECFHEGWYYHRLVDNLCLAFFQYWCWPIAFGGLSALGFMKPRIGAGLFVLIGVLVNWLLFRFQNMFGIEFILLPCVALAALFCFGRVRKPVLAAWLAVGFPVLVIAGISIPLLIKVSGRLTDIRNEPLVWASGHETLVWAPPGPGWPTAGVSYERALWVCDHLSLDGRSLSDKPRKLWRLPTVQEAIRAMNRHGKPAGCEYSGKQGFQPCTTEPDKEAPLWNPFSQVIYWWTATDDSRGHNLRVTYNGSVLAVQKSLTGYTAFRAVRSP